MFDQSIDFRDLKILSELSHHHSLRNLSRFLEIEPQNLSKILKNLEAKLNTTLILRSSKGITLTEDGSLYSKKAEALLKFNDDNFFLQNKNQHAFTIVSRVFINICIAPKLTSSLPEYRFRFIDGSPTKKEIWARLGAVDFVVSVGLLDLGKNFTTQKIGELEWSFFVNKSSKLKDNESLENLKDYKFLGSSYIEGEKLREVFYFDQFKKYKIQMSHCTETTLTSMMIASQSSEIVFLPKILVKILNFEDHLKEIKIAEIPRTVENVYLSCHQDKIKRQVFENIQVSLTNLFY